MNRLFDHTRWVIRLSLFYGFLGFVDRGLNTNFVGDFFAQNLKIFHFPLILPVGLL